MSYLFTARLEARNLLVRVEVQGAIAIHTLHYQDGSTATYESMVTGTDGAIADLVRDLVWAEVDCAIEIVHAGTVDQDYLNLVLERIRPAYELLGLQTSMELQ